MPSKLSDIQKDVKKQLKITFKKNNLLEAALTHPSYRNENKCRKLEDFDRLEFFGDTILNFVICKKMFKLFPKADEGELSRLRSTLVSRKILFRVAKDIGLSKLIRLSKNLKKQAMDTKVKLMADAFEAFLGALFYDQGFDKTEKFILKHFKPYLDPKRLMRLDPNPKSTLQELCLKEWKKLPQYQNKISHGVIETTVSITTRLKEKASGRSRQESEQKAAKLLLKKIRQDREAAAKRRSSRKKLRKAR